MEMLDLDAVRAFVLVADLKSFTRAADALGTTQSAVSLKLKRLEAVLGRRLLERTPRTVRLSAQGEAFVGGGIAAVGAAAAAGLAVAPLARRAAPRGLVDVGAKLGLPALPASRICLHSRLRDGRSAETLRLLANSLRTG
jgi:DNA-binding transcriptional LysR family regulator